ncbi:NAD(P)H-dependent oxidoreductase [Variovorax sp.]|uniref:NAD(P)H-dependent oxidoreductase n=1 Tax=Variovorax sp. TaxID=1871043 RepID=UPI0025F34016|nr:NAD(P)H-dependent oxidoreductase [Variovorax sp.]
MPTQTTMPDVRANDGEATGIVGISGHVSMPSRTLWLAEHLVARLAAATGEPGRVHAVIDDPAGLGATLAREHASARLEGVLHDIEASTALVVVTPVYKGSYAGLFKHLIDLVDMKALAGRPVIVAATGYSERHAGVIDHALRPLFAFFGAVAMPTGVYAGKADIDEQHRPGPALEAAIGGAIAQAAHAVAAARPNLN